MRQFVDKNTVNKKHFYIKMAAALASPKTDGSTLPLAGNVKMLGHDVPLIIDTLPMDTVTGLLAIILEIPSIEQINLHFGGQPSAQLLTIYRRQDKLWAMVDLSFPSVYNPKSVDVLAHINNLYGTTILRLSIKVYNTISSITIYNVKQLATNFTAVAESLEVLDAKNQPTGVMRKDESYINGTPKRISFYKGGKQYGEEVYFATNGQIIWRRFWLSDGKTSYLDGIDERYFFLMPPKVIDVNGTKLLLPVPAITKYWIAGKEVTKESFDGRKETVTQETPLVPDLADMVSKYL